MDFSGNTPLHLAVAAGQAPAAQVLPGRPAVGALQIATPHLVECSTHLLLTLVTSHFWEMAMIQDPNRPPSEHPNPTTKNRLQNGW